MIRMIAQEILDEIRADQDAGDFDFDCKFFYLGIDPVYMLRYMYLMFKVVKMRVRGLNLHPYLIPPKLPKIECE